MERKVLTAILFLVTFACATHREPAATAPSSDFPAKPEVPGFLTPSGLGSSEAASARIQFKISKKSSAELGVVDQRKRLFFVFEGWDLQGGFYEVWALERCARPGAGSVLKALASEGRLMGFRTLHGFVVTEGSSDRFDLAPDSKRSLMTKRIALFRQQKTKVQKLDCGVLQATDRKTSTAFVPNPSFRSL